MATTATDFFNDSFLNASAIDVSDDVRPSLLDGFVSQSEESESVSFGDDDDFTFCKLDTAEKQQVANKGLLGAAALKKHQSTAPTAAAVATATKGQDSVGAETPPTKGRTGRRVSHTKGERSPEKPSCLAPSRKDSKVPPKSSAHQRQYSEEDVGGPRRDRRASKPRMTNNMEGSSGGNQVLDSSSSQKDHHRSRASSTRMDSSSSHHQDQQHLIASSSSHHGRRKSALEAAAAAASARRGSGTQQLTSSSHHSRRRHSHHNPGSRSTSPPEPEQPHGPGLARRNTAPAKRMSAMVAAATAASSAAAESQHRPSNLRHSIHGTNPRAAPQPIERTRAASGRTGIEARRRQSRLALRRSFSADETRGRFVHNNNDSGGDDADVPADEEVKNVTERPKAPPPNRKLRRSTVDISQRQVLRGLALQDKRVKQEEKEYKEQMHLEAMMEKMQKLNEELERQKEAEAAERAAAAAAAAQAHQQAANEHGPNNMMNFLPGVAAPRMFVDNAANQISATATAAALAAQARAAEAALRAQNISASAAHVLTGAAAQAAGLLRFPGEFEFVRRQGAETQAAAMPVSAVSLPVGDDDNHEHAGGQQKFARGPTNQAASPASPPHMTVFLPPTA